MIKRSWNYILVAIFSLVLLSGAALEAEARALPELGFADLAEQLSPTVVNIATKTEIIQRENPLRGKNPQFPEGQNPFDEFFREFMERGFPEFPGPMPRAPHNISSLGSGFIIDETGYIVTNNHVVENADEIMVTLHDDTQLKAKLIGRDPKTDLALLKVEPQKPLPYITWGDSDVVRVGEWVLAIGNPFGLGGTVTAGIVSARARTLGAGPYDDFLQTDASINKGNSGGPMFNLNGEVIGINSAIVSPSGGSVGIGFAIPSSLAKSVIEQLKAYGHTKRGWLGVRIQVVSEEIAESLGRKDTKGALVISVDENGPAKSAGIKAGDIILSFNGKEIAEMRTLPRIVAETEIDSQANVVIWRDGEEKTVKLNVKLMPEELNIAQADEGEKTKKDLLGLHLETLTPTLRDRYNIPTKTNGVFVVDIEPNSVAEQKGIMPGDIIVEVGQQKVSQVQDVIDIVQTYKKEEKSSLLFLIERRGEFLFVALRLQPKE